MLYWGLTPASKRSETEPNCYHQLNVRSWGKLTVGWTWPLGAVRAMNGLSKFDEQLVSRTIFLGGISRES